MIQCVWGTESDGAAWGADAALGTLPDELSSPRALGITNKGILWGRNLIIFYPISHCPFISRIIWDWLSPFNWHKCSLTKLGFFPLFFFFLGRWVEFRIKK